MLTFSVNDLVETIDIFEYATLVEIDGLHRPSDQLRIPVFQRETVWNDDQYTSLWDSILRFLPIGTIIVTDHPVASRSATVHSTDTSKNVISEVSTTGSPVSTTLPKKYYIIDGQQRSIAIAVGLTPTDPKMGCRLWIDLMPPEVKSIDSPKFKFYLCTKVHPWGEGVESSKEIDNAREELISSGIIKTINTSINGKIEKTTNTWDCDIPLKDTWPIKAKYPVPFAELADFILKSGSLIGGFRLLAKSVLSNKSINTRVEKIENEEIREKVEQQLKSIIDSLIGKRGKPRLIVTKSDFSELSDLLTAFTRLNTKGTELKPAELFYSAIKHEIPAMHSAIQDVWASCDRLFSPLDIVYVSTRLAISKTKIIKKGIKEINELSLAELKSIKENPVLWSEFIKQIQLLSGMSTSRSVINDAFLKLKSVLLFDSSNPKGLPIPLIIKLDKHSWHPIWRWIAERLSFGLSPWAGSTEFGLKHVLFDHFYRAQRTDLFKHDLPILLNPYSLCFDYLSLRGKYFEGTDPNRWAGKSLRLLDQTISSGTASFPGITGATVRAPFDPRDYEFQINEIFNHHKRLDEIINTDDLLLWNERIKLNKWFGALLKNVAIWKAKVKPYDRDHLIPSAFFNAYDATIAENLGKILNSNITKLNLYGTSWNWNFFKNLRDSIGNKHYLPTKMNRSAQTLPIPGKLSAGDYSKNHPLYPCIALLSDSDWQAISILTSTWSDWKKITKGSSHWTIAEIESFLNSVRTRRKELYKNLYDFIS